VLHTLNDITVFGINMLDALLVIIPPVVALFAGILIFGRTERYRKARRVERERYQEGGRTYPA
jgi:hypothetical protein